MVETKEKIFLKDNVANKVFRDKKCLEYVASILSPIIHIDKPFLMEHLKISDSRISESIFLKEQEVDSIFETDTLIINIEVNRKKYLGGHIKNERYAYVLYVDQLPPGVDYTFASKKIWQIL